MSLHGHCFICINLHALLYCTNVVLKSVETITNFYGRLNNWIVLQNQPPCPNIILKNNYFVEVLRNFEAIHIVDNNIAMVLCGACALFF